MEHCRYRLFRDAWELLQPPLKYIGLKATFEFSLCAQLRLVATILNDVAFFQFFLESPALSTAVAGRQNKVMLIKLFLVQFLKLALPILSGP